MKRGPGFGVAAAAVAAWGAALAYSTLAGRVMYGDGAWYVLVHLITPHRFNDYDFQRSFASFVSQAPMLFGQRAGLESASAYVMLYSFGALVIPAMLMMAALVLARRQPVLFAANVVGIAIYGFGTNFINTEANLLFGLVWLAATILALDRPAPLLRGFVLPVVSFGLLRTYEGMLLVGPFLALWAAIASTRAADVGERLGLLVAAFLFALGAVIGLGGFLSPRDASNASSFLGSALRYLGHPHAFLMASAFFALAAVVVRGGARIGCAVVSALLGAAFVAGIARLSGFYGFDVYYHNRSFMVLALPLLVAALLAAWYLRPHWLAMRGAGEGYAVLLVPIFFAVSGDMLGTHRWARYVDAFCQVLERPGTPHERIQALKSADVRTAWPWTHPTMSLLLRDRGSGAMVVNDPGSFGWEPFDPNRAPTIDYRGFCQAPPFAPAKADSFERPIVFSGARFPSYVAKVEGLARPESWGTWSEGPTVKFEFATPLPESFDLAVRVGTAYGANRGAPIEVRAGAARQAFVVDRDGYETTLQFREAGKATALTFVIPKPQSPLELGAGNDPRKLGIGFVSLRVIPR
ncbi:MAG TPA: hypothetical protein VEC19_10725 [Usitatibacter sp.]|nr:hypothetical protein [Usitatibacter sp.]